MRTNQTIRSRPAIAAARAGLLCMMIGAMAGTAVPANAQPAEAEAAIADGFSADQLEQLVAPVALYPDSLVMQIFMASTYPLEIVEADRWMGKNNGLKGEKLDTAVAAESWDDSVKSLTHFPDVLARMSNNLDWTKDMGDAFLGQQADVLAAVQVMRNKAQATGNLKSTGQQKVIVEQAQPPAEVQTVVVQAPPQVIRIEPADPEVVYVPTYSSTVVYGAPPPYSYYPSVYAYPPGYVAASAISFGVGMAVGAALWSDCDWNNYGVYGHGGHHGGDYHGGNYNGGNNSINIDGDVNIGSGNRNNIGGGDRNNIGNGNRQNSGKWQHNAEHRKGVGYKNDKVASKYGGSSAGNRGAGASQRPTGGRGTGASASQRPAAGGGRTGSAAAARPGTQPAGKGSLGGGRAGTQPAGKSSVGGARAGTQPSNKGSLGSGGSRAGTQPSNRASAGASRPSSQPGRGSSASRPSGGGGAFGGSSGSFDRAASSRGSSSRSGSYGGGSRGGGGSSRGGGGGSRGGGGGSRGGGGGSRGGGGRGGRR